MGFVEGMLNVSWFPINAHRLYHLIAVFCLVAVLLKITRLFLRRSEAIKILKQFPGPPTHWLYGHVHEFRQDGTDLDVSCSWGKVYPYAFPLWFGPFVPFLNICHPEYAKVILTTTEPKDSFTYTFLIPWIGEGLLVSDGSKWFRHRRLLTPGFHYDILKPYVKVMGDSVNVLLKKLERYSNKYDESVEMFQQISLLTLDIILKCAFSYNSNCQLESDTNSYVQAVYDLCHLTNLRLRTFPLHSDIIFHLTSAGYKFRKSCNIAHHHTEEVIKERKKALKDEKELSKIQKKRYLDFLDILLSAADEDGKGLSDEDIRAEVDTFMFEGHDTTASGISWILYNLALHPEHQQKCREEIQDVLSGEETMDWDHLSKIPYTTMCIKESLRLCPPVPEVARKLTKPIKFPDGRTLPEGFLIGIAVYNIHRCEYFWENPEVFDPMRFSAQESAERHPFAYIPFSAGPRNCIGQNFAMNEMKIAVAMILRRYELAVDSSKIPKKVPKLVLRSLNGIHLKLKKLD
ncbi:cytochrome P450 4B1-like [Erpetoichthys calabaricus]|uniref:cytochrome P450 4B1-like n=1 Tax=Erpetoichthys calabaricus TaxID=27687 RepID=UPI0022349DF5|nr:cytochrome P450 4B1-like [Erpetoichthys calabaricus]